MSWLLSVVAASRRPSEARPPLRPRHGRPLMAKAKKQLALPPMMPVAFVETWVLDSDGKPIAPGPQEAGTVVEIIHEAGKARRKRRHRPHILERLAKRRIVSETQMLAGLRLHDAWCLTLLSPPGIQEVRIDASPRPDNVAIHQVQRMQSYADMVALIPRPYREPARRLACDRLLPQTTRDLELARQGLMRLAKALGY